MRIFHHHEPPSEINSETLYKFLISKLSSAYQMTRTICLVPTENRQKLSIDSPNIIVFLNQENGRSIWLCKPTSLYHDRAILRAAEQRKNKHLNPVADLVRFMELAKGNETDQHNTLPDDVFYVVYHEFAGCYLLYMADHRKKTLTLFAPKSIAVTLYKNLEYLYPNVLSSFYRKEGYRFEHDYSGQQSIKGDDADEYFIMNRVLQALKMTGNDALACLKCEFLNTSLSKEDLAIDSADCFIATISETINLEAVDERRILFDWLDREKLLNLRSGDTVTLETLTPLLARRKIECMIEIDRRIKVHQSKHTELTNDVVQCIVQSCHELFDKDSTTDIDRIIGLAWSLKVKVKNKLSYNQHRVSTKLERALWLLLPEIWLLVANEIYFKAQVSLCFSIKSAESVKKFLENQRAQNPLYSKYFEQVHSAYCSLFDESEEKAVLRKMQNQFICGCIDLDREMADYMLGRINEDEYVTVPTPLLTKDEYFSSVKTPRI